jgi:hypothetical protein
MTDSHDVHESTAREQTRPSGGCGGKLLLAAIAGLLVYAGWDAYQGRQVLQTQALGPVVKVTGTVGLVRGLLVETPRGFFPVLGAAAFERGTELVLEVRGNGDRYLCDVPRTGCVKSARSALGRSADGGLKP